MGKVFKRCHSDEDVKFWAEVYTELNMTLSEIEEELKISHSTLWWCFIHRLPGIDYKLYEAVLEEISKNKTCKRCAKSKRSRTNEKVFQEIS